MRRNGHVCGTVDPAFEKVWKIFDDNVDHVGAGGVAFAVMVSGELVVDLWAGRAGDRPWDRYTRAVLMSATKGVATIAVARLVERGLLEIDAPVAQYWPEFSANGKASITVAHLLSHSAGLISIPGYEEILGPDGEGWTRTDDILARLESAAPEWPPGTAHVYHGLTFGWLVGELVRRTAGVSIGTLLRDEIADPLGLELDLGTPIEKHNLVAPVLLPDFRSAAAKPLLAQQTDPASPWYRLSLVIDGRSIVTHADRFFSNPELVTLELPSSNATGTARAVATLYGALVNGGSHHGVPVLSPATVDTFAAERRRGPDHAFELESRWGLGFQRPIPPRPGHRSPWGPHDQAFGHTGYGGQMGFADPVDQVGVGFVRSHLSWDSPLGGLLVDTVYECLHSA